LLERLPAFPPCIQNSNTRRSSESRVYFAYLFSVADKRSFAMASNVRYIIITCVY
jgi:hypothetical protein